MQTVETHRRLGQTDIFVSPVALGCWPIAGMTSLHVNDVDSLATIRAALERGVNFLDTAFCYGANGESEKLIQQATVGRRDEVVIASKGGIHWRPDGERVQDAQPATLKRQCEISLERLQTDHLDLLYLHAPDPDTPIEESAGALKELLDEGKTRAVGVSNCGVEQLRLIHAICPLAAVQPPYNMLQRQIENEIIPWCTAAGVSAVIYWPLMKGLLAGKLPRDFVFEDGDGRAKYPMFQGDEWRKNQDFLDDLKAIAAAAQRTVAQLVINWTIHQPQVTAALCGAKRASQIEETAGAMGWRLSQSQRQQIDDALAKRGVATVRRAV